MKRLLLSLLIISTLVSSVAWAWISHSEAVVDDRVSSTQTIDHANSSGDDHDTFHEHYCGHGWAHLLGLQPDYINAIAIHRDVLFLRYEPALLSEVTPPPSKPPRA